MPELPRTGKENLRKELNECKYLLWVLNRREYKNYQKISLTTMPTTATEATTNLKGP